MIDAMLPPKVAEYLNAAGHDAVTPAGLGAQNLSDDVLIQIATAEHRVIVTENAGDFAQVTTSAVLFVRKSWWPRRTLASNLAVALDRWAAAHPDPGPWTHWLDVDLR
ncbi:MAG: DUF5615 family PIN-like protein [Chloroflexi bacterium]|nr:DUF5615 family PIN-like protein [Chloroflexota bacterium]